MTAGLTDWNDAAMRRDGSTVANIVLPLDGSEVSRLAVPVARGLAELYKATLHLLFVGEQSLDPTLMLSRLGVLPEEIPGAVVDQFDGAAAEMIIRAGHALPRSMIVMCTHTKRRHEPDCFGSVTESVLAGGLEHIVLLAPERGDRPWSLQRVLLAHDGTPRCHVAAAPAADIAQRAGAEVIALHVAAPRVCCPQEPGSLAAPRYMDQPQHEWPGWAGEFMDRMLALGAPASSLQFKLVVTGGQPGSEVAQLARKREADLIVMAWDGHWEKSRHTATRVVIRTSGCPVMLVYSAGGP